MFRIYLDLFEFIRIGFFRLQWSIIPVLINNNTTFIADFIELYAIDICFPYHASCITNTDRVDIFIGLVYWPQKRKTNAADKKSAPCYFVGHSLIVYALNSLCNHADHEMSLKWTIHELS